MKKIQKLFLSLLVLIFIALISSCDSEILLNTQKEYTLVCWNLQTFFDGNIDGCEYTEFKKSEKWDEGKYKIRLNRLCESIKKLNADIFVFEEIENEKIIFDLSNMLCGSSWKNSERWNYAGFAKENGSSIGCAIISRIPIKEVKTHSLDIRTQKEAQPSMRPVMCVDLSAGKKEFCIIVNHWKSKSDGAEKSEIWRDWQEALCERIIPQDFPVLICGDFNRDAQEFIHFLNEEKFNENQNSANTIFRGFSEKSKAAINSTSLPCFTPEEKILYSPWYDENGDFSTTTGSYYYKDKWERIDHIFTNDQILILSFSPCAESPWLNEYGEPDSYKIYNGRGYSDHLPLKCTFQIL
ncbi:MAG: endonuclease/exonuclease/phosphatase family protein [Treponema sp.]|nr:endonuclease/exonuclease/phosphatase family protein [Treponema sp.]